MSPEGGPPSPEAALPPRGPGNVSALGESVAGSATPVSGAPPSTPRGGDVLLGKYRVDGVVDEGGMGVILAGTHLQLGHRVAVKVMRPELARQKAFVDRFVRESQAASRLRSEHVARVYDVGVLENGLPFMVMELLEGETLAARLRRRGRLEVTECVAMVLQTCDAVAQAHALGIVHRDLKPDNLFVTTGVDGLPSVKVLDFGISKLLQVTPGDLNITTTTDVFGSPRYMSPEQMRSARDVDARSDLWSLGTIVYELLSGRPSFDASSMPELSAKILRDEPTPLLTLRPDLPAGLVAVVARCLEKEPSRRYPSVAELASALAAFGGPAAQLAADRVGRILRAAAPPPSAPGSGPSSGPASREAGLALTLPELPDSFHAAETLQARGAGRSPLLLEEATGSMTGNPTTETQWEHRREGSLSGAERPETRRGVSWKVVVGAVAGLAVLAGLAGKLSPFRTPPVLAPSAAAGAAVAAPTDGPAAPQAPSPPGPEVQVPAATPASLGVPGPAAPTPVAATHVVHSTAATRAASRGTPAGPSNPVVAMALSAPSATPAASAPAPPPAVSPQAPPAPSPPAASAEPPAKPRGLFDYRN